MFDIVFDAAAAVVAESAFAISALVLLKPNVHSFDFAPRIPAGRFVELSGGAEVIGLLPCLRQPTALFASDGSSEFGFGDWITNHFGLALAFLGAVFLTTFDFWAGLPLAELPLLCPASFSM